MNPPFPANNQQLESEETSPVLTLWSAIIALGFMTRFIGPGVTKGLGTQLRKVYERGRMGLLMYCLTPGSLKAASCQGSGRGALHLQVLQTLKIQAPVPMTVFLGFRVSGLGYFLNANSCHLCFGICLHGSFPK